LYDIPQARAGIRYIPHIDAITSFMLLHPMGFDKPLPMQPGPVNLPNGGHAKTGRLSPGAVPWRCAAMPGSAISGHTMIAPERSARSPDDDMAWRARL